MAYKAIAEYGLNQTIGPMSISTLSSGGIDESGGGAPWGRDQVLQFINFFLSSYSIFSVCWSLFVRNRDTSLILFRGRCKRYWSLHWLLHFPLSEQILLFWKVLVLIWKVISLAIFNVWWFSLVFAGYCQALTMHTL